MYKFYSIRVKRKILLIYFYYRQVETVGDKYMAVSGIPEPCEFHTRCIGRLALDMMDLAPTVIVDDKPVVCDT